jgi:N-formylglutamate amidohydrolase
MKEETRQRLTDFYAPYNARLQGLVQGYRVRMLT